MSNKNQEKLEKNFEKLLRSCKEKKGGIHTIAISPNKAIARGLGPDYINPYTAIYFSSISGFSDFKGIISYSPISSKIDIESILIAIENQDSKKPSIYISSDNQLRKFNYKSELEAEEKILLYWEYGPYSCFFFVLQDPVTSTTIVECMFSEIESTQKSNRYLFLNLLPTKEKDIALNLFKESMENKKDFAGAIGYEV